MRRFTIAIALLCLFAPRAYSDELFSLKAGYLKLTPEGDVAVSGNGVTGTSLDIENDLFLDSDDGYFAEAALQLGDFRLFTAYVPINFSGESLLTQDVSFNGETFVINSHVKTEIDIDIYEAGIAWFAVNLDDMPVRLQVGPEIAVKYIDAKIKMRAELQPDSEKQSVGVPVPSIGARARVAVGDYLGFIGRAGYVEYDENSFMDVDAQVEFSPIPLVGVYAGYRYLDINVDESDVLIDATFAGPYAGAMVRF